MVSLVSMGSILVRCSPRTQSPRRSRVKVQDRGVRDTSVRTPSSPCRQSASTARAGARRTGSAGRSRGIWTNSSGPRKENHSVKGSGRAPR